MRFVNCTIRPKLRQVPRTHVNSHGAGLHTVPAKGGRGNGCAPMLTAQGHANGAASGHRTAGRALPVA
ncbi:hypothetical protein BP5796_07934 [Coleophoma crateriformis]|uniref:Uncharacterized protein n=1 Tax=Coleophoma crateriformis TaxID=565419 RepID=A0A3D8RD57_9HELO|nr:hypothetical protein BP5796_07934 [Coleophoma crateriformis]